MLLEQARLAERSPPPASGPPGPPGVPLRERLLAAVLTGLDRWYTAFRAGPGSGGDPDACGLRPGYLALSATVGRDVRVLLPGDREITGRATDVDRAGRLVVQTPAGPSAVSAGDVVHLR